MKTPLFQAFLALSVAGYCTAAQALSVQVVDPAGRPVADVVVVVSPSDGRAVKTESANRAHAQMDQRNREFVPQVLVIEAGTWVDFPNSDSVSHQVYSFSPAKPFQLPLYKGSAHPPVLFDRAGVVTLGCNIHDNMLGYIYVADSPWFGKTDIDGRWASGALPIGRYDLRIWSPRIRDTADSLHRLIDVGDRLDLKETFKLDRKVKAPAAQPANGKPWDDY
ncbi:MAG TPA: methylamine utilization protein [Steroidobacteraceae bacterium]|nr:methylamine utilization protein [Steroidobacteraceae bacterium]